MKRVKSAMEIAMEKAQNMGSPSQTDKEDYREYTKAAEILASSLLENKTHPEKAKEAFDRYPDEAKNQVLKVFYEKFASGINYHNAPSIIEVLKHISSDQKIHQACEDLNSIHAEIRQQVDAKLAEAKDGNNREAIQKLAREGIKGSAIYQVRPREKDIREAVLKQFEEEFNRQLSGFCSFLAAKAQAEEEV